MESFPSRKNYQELADVFSFTAVSAMNLALWFILEGANLLLLMLNYVLFLGIWAVLIRYGLSPETLLEVQLFMLGCFYIMYTANRANDLTSRVYFVTWVVLGSTFVVIGVVGVIIAIYRIIKRKNETSNQMLMKILNNSTMLFVNGYVVLCFLCVKQENNVWKILGDVFLGVLGLLCLIWCPWLVSSWREYRTRNVRVSNSNEVA